MRPSVMLRFPLALVLAFAVLVADAFEVRELAHGRTNRLPTKGKDNQERGRSVRHSHRAQALQKRRIDADLPADAVEHPGALKRRHKPAGIEVKLVKRQMNAGDDNMLSRTDWLKFHENRRLTRAEKAWHRHIADAYGVYLVKLGQVFGLTQEQLDPRMTVDDFDHHMANVYNALGNRGVTGAQLNEMPRHDRALLNARNGVPPTATELQAWADAIRPDLTDVIHSLHIVQMEPPRVVP